MPLVLSRCECLVSVIVFIREKNLILFYVCNGSFNTIYCDFHTFNTSKNLLYIVGGFQQ